MKLIIDIDERIYSKASKNKKTGNSLDYIDELSLEVALENGTPLEGKTNGDVIKIMFPHIEIFEPNKYEIAIKQDLGWLAFKKNWWNAPYKEINNETNN